MLYTIPDYYKEFHCTADQCEDTCCAGWQIVIDRNSLRKYGKVKGPFRKQLNASINWIQGTFCQTKERRCAFLNEQNLCEMYANLGKGSLCKTCRLYPRHIEEFEGVRELTLSLSCPEVAKLLLHRADPVRFQTVERPGEEEYEDFDVFLYSMLDDARLVMLQILQNRALCTDVRIGLILGIAHDIQGRVQRSALFSCGEVLEEYQTEQAAAFVQKKITEQKPGRRYELSKKRMQYLFGLEFLKEDWYIHLCEVQDILYAGGAKGYEKDREEFLAYVKADAVDWEIVKEQLLVYFLSTYFCGAVYDGKIFAKAQFVVISVFLLEEMWLAGWKKNGKEWSLEEAVDLVCRFSREIEHSDENIKKMENIDDKEIC